MSVTISPNMGLPVPVVGVEPGPAWATDLNSSLSILDGHNHSVGSGVQITPAGLNINANLPLNSNNLTTVRTVRFQPQVSLIAATAPDVGCLYESGVDLYYNDGNGNQIRITQGGSLAGAAGTITGLPSGTASASFSSASGTFVWQQATSTAANSDIGSLILRYPGSYPTPAGNYIAIQAPSSLTTGYGITLPINTPAATSFMTMNTSGVIGVSTALNGALTSSNLSASAGILGTQLAATQQISASSGSFSTTSGSLVAVTNLSVTITTSGRPVMIMLQDDSSGSTSGLEAISAQMRVCLFRGVSQITQYDCFTSSGTLVLPGSSIQFIDVISAGTYTYSVQVAQLASGTAAVLSTVLVAVEL